MLCGLTNEKPTFENHCPDFKNDETIKEIKTLSLNPNNQRVNALFTILWIVLALKAVSLISSGLQFNLLQTVSNGGQITNEAANANDLREQIINILFIIGYIISGISFIMWFRRAYFNLHQKVNSLAFTEGWAAGSWFVPIVNLYRPYQIMNELYTETKKYLLGQNENLRVDLDTKYL